jgi:hypothetical protein
MGMSKDGKVKRFIGNVADDAKDFFDEMLDRDTATATAPIAPQPPVTGLPGVPGVPPLSAATDLAALPQQIAHLTTLMEQMLATLRAMQHAPGGVGVVGTPDR